MKILILVAHPDDEVILCGATISKLVKKNHSVFVSFYTQNCQGYFNKESQEARKKRAIEETKKSAEYLGFELNFLGFHDMEVEKNKGILIKKTVNEIRRLSPDVIITHSLQDKHIDHKTLAEIVPEANFQSGCEVCGGKRKWSAELLLQGEINLEMTMPFDFQVVCSVSFNDIKNKINAFRLYSSVKGEHKTSQILIEKRVRSVAGIRGATIGKSYGEAFIMSNFSPLNSRALKIASMIM